MHILTVEDANRAHASLATLVAGQATRYNNKRADHRMIKWIIPYESRLRRAIAALKRAKIPFDRHENVVGSCIGFSIRVPLDYVAPVNPHVAVKANQRDALADALALVLDLAEGNALTSRDANANGQEDLFARQQRALALVETHLAGMKKAK